LAKLDPKQDGKVKTLVFLSPLEYDIFAKALFDLADQKKRELVDAVSQVDKAKLVEDEDNDEDAEEEEAEKKNKGEKKLSAKQFTKLVAKILKSPIEKAFKGEKKETKSLPKDAADIAFFGRMVANDHSLTVEGAALFSHALSTHKADNEIDFFAGVDDLQPKEESGAGITGTLEFNSATYYRFAAINLDMLFDKYHLACLDHKERKAVVNAFIKATLQAVPVARRNSMNGNVFPNYVLCVIREKGHPVQLVNAFEEPVFSKSGVVKKSIESLEKEYEGLKETWGLEAVSEVKMPEKKLSDLLAEVEKYVPAPDKK
jgi:CRISPR system Cascade subunit CasC